MENKDISGLPNDFKNKLLQDILNGNLNLAQVKSSLQQKILSQKRVAEVIGGPRSAEARNLPCVLNGKIVLRPDAKIDIPELGIKGLARLSVEGPTDLTNGLLQGGGDRGGVPGISYISGDRAIQETKKQGLYLFSATEAQEIIKALLKIFSSNQMGQAKALQALFGKRFSGLWDTVLKKWHAITSVSYLGISEMDTDGEVTSFHFGLNSAGQCPLYKDYLQQFLAFEEYHAPPVAA